MQMLYAFSCLISLALFVDDNREQTNLLLCIQYSSHVECTHLFI